MTQPDLLAATTPARATFSPCGQYRYTLLRGPFCSDPDAAGEVLFIMLNPSTADAERDDNTIRRCIAFARDWGFGWLRVVNAYAWQATKPRELWRQRDPIGPYNDAAILLAVSRARRVIVAWGGNIRPERVEDLRLLLVDFPRSLFVALHVNEDGTPSHPLYQPADLAPAIYHWPNFGGAVQTTGTIASVDICVEFKA